MTSACITRQATLGDYLDLLAGQDLVASTCNFDPNHANLAVHFATADSREVVAHTLFVCKGRAFKEEYLTSATQTGAVAYVSEVEYPQAGIPGILVTDIRRAMEKDAGRAEKYFALVNVAARLRSRYGGRASIDLSSRPGEGTEVVIRVPVTA